MANSNFPTHKPLSLLLTITICITLLLNKANSSEVVSFRFKNFDLDQQDLLLQSDAVVTSTGKIQLTDDTLVNGSLGRALYSTPIRLWDKTTGNVASFYTSFDFLINAPNTNTKGHGLAFFIAPVDTKPGSGAGYLGLFDSQVSNKSNQIVAVEFDTYYDQDWDVTKGAHIGIDVNTIKSKKVTTWGFRNGTTANALITYLAPSKTLVASLVYPSGKTSYIVSAGVDLKSVVPEWVRIGLTATTDSSHVETHDILSWRFKSKLKSSSSTTLKDEEDDMDLASFMDDSMEEVGPY